MLSVESVYGIHAVESGLSQHPERIREVCFQVGRCDRRVQRLLTLCKQNKIKYSMVSRHDLDKIFIKNRKPIVHQGVVAYMITTKTRIGHEADLHSCVADLEEIPLIVILDSVTDPHNLGACLRSADAAGAHAVVMTKDRAAPLNSTVSKVACGAAENTTIYSITNLVRTMKELKNQGVWIFGTTGEAESTIYEQDFTVPTAIVMGSEEKGIRRLTREQCDSLVKLPMLGIVPSLNVSVATGVCLYEVVRQRFQALS